MNPWPMKGLTPLPPMLYIILPLSHAFDPRILQAMELRTASACRFKNVDALFWFRAR